MTQLTQFVYPTESYKSCADCTTARENLSVSTQFDESGKGTQATKYKLIQIDPADSPAGTEKFSNIVRAPNNISDTAEINVSERREYKKNNNNNSNTRTKGFSADESFETEFEELLEEWEGSAAMPRLDFELQSELKAYLKKLGVSAIRDAMQKAKRNNSNRNGVSWNYFKAILNDTKGGTKANGRSKQQQSFGVRQNYEQPDISKYPWAKKNSAGESGGNQAETR